MITIKNLAATALLLATFLLFGKNVPPKPNPLKLVNDYANILSVEERNTLEQKLTAYFDSTSTQIAIVIEPTLDGDDAFSYSHRLAQEWGIGEKGKNNGLLIYLSMQEREIRIQTGYGMEGVVPDALAKRIINEIIIPNFKAKQYYRGLHEATDVIMLAAGGEYKYTRNKKNKEELPGWVIVIIIILVLMVISRKGGGGGRGFRYLNGPMWWGTLSSGGHRGGSSWGGGMGGGFGGFGGGSFGGGGAGGRW
jgi:uncharacterized protein